MVAHLQGVGGGEDSARQLGRRIERQMIVRSRSPIMSQTIPRRSIAPGLPGAPSSAKKRLP